MAYTDDAQKKGQEAIHNTEKGVSDAANSVGNWFSEQAHHAQDAMAKAGQKVHETEVAAAKFGHDTVTATKNVAHAAQEQGTRLVQETGQKVHETEVAANKFGHDTVTATKNVAHTAHVEGTKLAQETGHKLHQARDTVVADAGKAEQWGKETVHQTGELGKKGVEVAVGSAIIAGEKSAEFAANGYHDTVTATKNAAHAAHVEGTKLAQETGHKLHQAGDTVVADAGKAEQWGKETVHQTGELGKKGVEVAVGSAIIAGEKSAEFAANGYHDTVTATKNAAHAAHVEGTKLAQETGHKLHQAGDTVVADAGKAEQWGKETVHQTGELGKKGVEVAVGSAIIAGEKGVEVAANGYKQAEAADLAVHEAMRNQAKAAVAGMGDLLVNAGRGMQEAGNERQPDMNHIREQMAAANVKGGDSVQTHSAPVSGGAKPQQVAAAGL